MRSYKQIIHCVFIFFVINNLIMLPQVAKGQDFIETMRKCSTNLDKNTKLGYVLQIIAYGKATDASTVWTKEGETEAIYYKNKDKYYYKFQTTEWIADSKGSLSISHPQLLMMYQKNRGLSPKPKSPLQQMDSLVSKYKTWKSVEFKVLDSKHHQYTINSPQANLVSLVLVVDISLFYIVQVEYTYVKSVVGENLKTVMNFNNFSLNPQYPKDIFDYSRYIGTVNGKMVLQAPYKKYQLVTNE